MGSALGYSPPAEYRGTSDGIIILGGASFTLVSRGISSLEGNLYIIEDIANKARLTPSGSPAIYSKGKKMILKISKHHHKIIEKKTETKTECLFGI